MIASFHRQATGGSNADIDAMMEPPDGVTCAIFSPRPDPQWIVDTDTLDIALAWQLAGIETVLEISFNWREEIPLSHLLEICGGAGMSISLALPETLDDTSRQQWIEWNRLATELLLQSMQRCFVFPVSQYIEWMLRNAIEPQDPAFVTLPSHAYGLWVADAITRAELTVPLKQAVAEETDRHLGHGWIDPVCHQIANTLFHHSGVSR